MADREARQPPRAGKMGWVVVFWWVLANGLGSLLGSILPFMLTFFLGGFERQPRPPSQVHPSFLEDIIFIGILGVIYGLMLGVAQWLVIRRHVSRSGLWFLATAISGIVAFILTTYLPVHIPLNWGVVYRAVTSFGVTFGLVNGIFQWLFLNGRVKKAWFWIFSNMADGMVAGAVFGDLGMIGEGFGWTLGSLITGITLVWLLNNKIMLSRDQP